MLDENVMALLRQEQFLKVHGKRGPCEHSARYRGFRKKRPITLNIKRSHHATYNNKNQGYQPGHKVYG